MATSIPPHDDATILCPHLDVALQRRKNYIWSAGLALGWRQLMERAGGPIVLAGVESNAPAAVLVRELNRSAVELTSLPAGVAHGSLEASETGRIIVGGEVAIHPTFAVPFLRRARPAEWREREVNIFGHWYDKQEPQEMWKRRGEQILVHFPLWTDDEVGWLDDDDIDAAYNRLVVELQTLDDSIRVILAVMEPSSTLRDTIQRTLSYVQEGKPDSPMARFGRGESICIPVMHVDRCAVLDELAARTIDSGRIRGQTLGTLRNTTSFCLDEGGPTLASFPENPYGRVLMLPRRWYSLDRLLVVVLHRPSGGLLFAAWCERPEDLSV